MPVVHLPNGAFAEGIVILDPDSGAPTVGGGSVSQEVISPSDETFIGTIAAAGTILKQDISSWRSFILEFAATAGSHSIIVEGNATGLDADQWYPLSGWPVDIASTGAVATRPVTTGYTAFVYPKRLPWVRVRISVYGGSGTITARVTVSNNDIQSGSWLTTLIGMANNNQSLSGSPYFMSMGGNTRLTNQITDITGAVSTPLTFATGSQLLNIPYSVPEATWQYACPTGGIVNTTTAVVVKTAAGAGLRNYLASISLSTDTLGTATEFVILDGSTVIYRVKLLTTALPACNIKFPVPLRGSTNTALSIQTLTATTTGGVYCSASGYAAP